MKSFCLLAEGLIRTLSLSHWMILTHLLRKSRGLQMAQSCSYQRVDNSNLRRFLMKYTDKKDERESSGERCITSSSTKRGNMTKRLLLLALVTMSVVFAGNQSVPTTTQANVACELVCGAPYVGADGQCYVDCCPTDPQCMNPCERRLCK